MPTMTEKARVMAYLRQRGAGCMRLTWRQVRRVQHKRNHANAPFSTKADA